jgi:hypothetical protein
MYARVPPVDELKKNDLVPNAAGNQTSSPPLELNIIIFFSLTHAALLQ